MVCTGHVSSPSNGCGRRREGAYPGPCRWGSRAVFECVRDCQGFAEVREGVYQQMDGEVMVSEWAFQEALEDISRAAEQHCGLITDQTVAAEAMGALSDKPLPELVKCRQCLRAWSSVKCGCGTYKQEYGPRWSCGVGLGRDSGHGLRRALK